MFQARRMLTGLVAIAIVSMGFATESWAQQTSDAATAESRNDQIVDAFILYDIGRLRGPEATQAVRAYNELTGDGAIPSMVRGVNKAARMRQSCPIIVLARKLDGMLRATSDPEMLEYAIRNLDSSGTGVHYASYVERLRELAQGELYGNERVTLELRAGTTSQLQRAKKPVDQWSYDDLKEAIYQERGTQLVRVLEELMRRKGAEHTVTLAEAIAAVPDDNKELARGLLAQRLARMTDRTLVAKLDDPEIEIRAAAVRAIGYKGSPLYQELAAALRDKPMVADHAHQALVKLTGEDFGPTENAPAMDWYRASKRWEDWAEQQESSNAERAP